MRASPLRPVTADEADAFHRDGAVLIKRVLDSKWVDLARSGLDAAIAEPDALSGVLDRELRVDQFPAARSADLRAIVEESPVAEIVGSAMRTFIPI